MKKGFTLIELLAVIIVLGIVTLIAYPIITHQIDLANNSAYERTIASIEDAARRYGVEHNLGYSTTEQVLELSTLVTEGLLKQNQLVDQRTDNPLTGCVYYKWDIENNIYQYRYDPSC